MKFSFLSIVVLLTAVLPQVGLAADSAALKPYQPDLSKTGFISCNSGTVKDQVITALPLQSGSLMIPVDKSDLSAYDRVAVCLKPVSGEFQANSFAAALRADRQYHLAGFELRPVIKKGEPIEIIFNLAELPRKEVSFFRLYFNRTGSIKAPVKFKLESVEFYRAKMISKLPFEKYRRKLDETLIFPRIQIKYSLFLNYYSIATRDMWLDRPLLFNRELANGDKEFSKGGNSASFRKNAEIVSTYANGFSILATSKSYLRRTLDAMNYADQSGFKNFLMLEVSPAIVSLGKNIETSGDYDFIFEIVKAAKKSPSAFRIKDKVVLSSYNANAISPEQWKPVIKKLKEQTDGKLLFIAEIRSKFYKANNEYIKNGGKISLEMIREMKKFIRSYLDVADGVLFAGCNHIVERTDDISSYRFGNNFYRDIFIPTIVSVFNEPKYRSKYLGLSAAKGYLYPRHASGGQNEEGTLTLRRSLDAALAVQPDFIVMPEWNEANENTHIEPTIYDSFASRRVINHYRKIKANNNDDHSLPDLIISYRSELVFGETLTIELLNIPDPAYRQDKVNVTLSLKNINGQVIKSFEPIVLNNQKLDEKRLKIPIEAFPDERVLIPELTVSCDGKNKIIHGLSCIMLNTPPTMNKKYVKQPIRDLCVMTQEQLQWSSNSQGIKVAGSLKTETPFSSVELLENNIPVAAVDAKHEYHCSKDEILLRFCWNGASGTNRIPCSIKPLTGGIKTVDSKSIVMREADKTAITRNGNSITKDLIFVSHIDQFFFKTTSDAELEISVGNKKIQVSAAEIEKFSVYRKVFDDGKTIAIEKVIRLPEIPCPLNRKNVEFTLQATNLFSAPVYTVRAVTESGKTFRSAPYCPQKLSGQKAALNVWSYSQQKVITCNIPIEYTKQINYDFTPAAGDILPTIPPYRIFYTRLGGFDQWSAGLYNKSKPASAPEWKLENGNNVLAFDGIGNYLIMPMYLISEQSFTFSFSIMPTDNAPQTIFQTYASPLPGFQGILQDGSLSGYFLNRQGKKFEFKTKPVIKSGQWNDITICYDMEKLSIQINGGDAETIKCNGLLYRQPYLIFGGSYVAKGTSRFKGLLRSLSYANYQNRK